jgi:hypothetical protein
VTRIRAVVVVLGGALLCAATRGADASAPDATNAALDDSIAAARRQLDMLKADANAAKAGTRTGATPSIAMPELHTAEESAARAVVPVSPNEKAAAKRRQNWLVDAMMKPRRGKNGERADGRSDPDALDLRGRSRRDEPRSLDGQEEDAADPPSLLQSDEELASDAEAARHGTSQPPPSALNPLSQYMSSWLAPQDYSVLRHTVDSASDPSSSPAGVPSPSSLPGADSPIAAALANLDGPRNDVTRSLPAPADNPYLQTLAVPTPPPPASSVQPDSVPSVVPAPALFTPIPPGEVAPQKPVIPDFARPSDDDKYFKPLKRF